MCYNCIVIELQPWDNYVFRRYTELKREYIRPEYDNNTQLDDVILISIQEDAENSKITGIVDIEDLFG